MFFLSQLHHIPEHRHIINKYPGLRSQEDTHKHLTFNRALCGTLHANENETIPSYVARRVYKFINQPLSFKDLKGETGNQTRKIAARALCETIHANENETIPSYVARRVYKFINLPLSFRFKRRDLESNPKNSGESLEFYPPSYA